MSGTAVTALATLTAQSRDDWAGSNRGVTLARVMRILVIDVGGTHVKVLATGRKEPIKIPSGPAMTAKQMVRRVRASIAGWKFDAVSIGYPGPVLHGKPVNEPRNLGTGWVGFDFRRAFGCPVRVINDAALQALGSYHGGRMLFLGLGTGLGSALAFESMLFPLELGDLPYRDRDIIENFLGIPGIERLGEQEWKREVIFAVTQLKKSFIVDYVVLGGGNVHRFDQSPEGIERGKNENAFLGGLRLWERESPT